MARHWTHHIRRGATEQAWYIQSFEWELDYHSGESYLSDIDEPAISYGLLFSTPEIAQEFAARNGIRISNHNPVPVISND